jgi:hypothetical protein
MIHTIILNTYVLPHLPPPLYKLAYPKASGKPSLGNTLQTASLSDTLSSYGSGSGGSQLAGSVVSTLTIPSGTNTTANNKQRGTLCQHQSGQHFVEHCRTQHENYGDAPPPTLDNGQQPCLSYMLRGGCQPVAALPRTVISCPMQNDQGCRNTYALSNKSCAPKCQQPREISVEPTLQLLHRPDAPAWLLSLWVPEGQCLLQLTI